MLMLCKVWGWVFNVVLENVRGECVRSYVRKGVVYVFSVHCYIRNGEVLNVILERSAVCVCVCKVLCQKRSGACVRSHVLNVIKGQGCVKCYNRSHVCARCYVCNFQIVNECMIGSVYD